MSHPPDDNNDTYFEGTEKLFEIWFRRNCAAADASSPDLRNITQAKWSQLLAAANCRILSKIADASTTAYLLSESSLFVSERRVILKTCGRTTPIEVIEPLLELARQCGFSHVEDVYYSRKNFLKPELQWDPHRAFESEVRLLDRHFDGAAYCMGRLNDDCWYLYTLNPTRQVKLTEPDQTLEVLMTGLDPETMKVFYQSESKDAQEARQRSGLDSIFPQALIDDSLFEPCGYSLNALLKSDAGSGFYANVHVTPEQAFSYVSFETNFPHAHYSPLIERLVELFRPQKYLVTSLANDASAARPVAADELQRLVPSGYARSDMQFSRLRNYDLVYVTFEKATIDDAAAKR